MQTDLKNQDPASNDTIPLACDLTALDSTARAAHVARATTLLFEAVQECQELADGYALRFDADQYPQVVEFIANERLCCAFFHFVLDVAPAQGPIWLRITGGAGVKAFFQAGLGLR